MGEIRIRELEDWVVSAYKARAEQAGRSLEEELRITLTDIMERNSDELLDRLDRHRKMMRDKYGVLPDSTPLIRADRDERG